MPRTLPALLLSLLIAGTLVSGIAPRAQAAPTPTLLSGPDAKAFEATPDVAFVAFTRSQGSNPTTQVYGVPISGGTPTLLSPPGVPASLVTTTADSQSAVYLVAGNTASAGVFLVPIGGGGSVKLNPPLPGSDFLIYAYASPNRRYVMYLVGHEKYSASEIYSIALDTRMVARLTPLVAEDETIEPRFVTPNSQYAVFTVGTSTAVTTYAAPLAGGASVRLFGPVAPSYSPPPYTTADSSSIFIRQQRSPNIFTIYLVPLDGSPPHELVAGLGPNTTIDLFGTSADSRWAVVETTTNFGKPDSTYSLLSVRLDGSSAPMELTSGAGQNGSVFPILLSNDGQWVVYLIYFASGLSDVYSVPIGGSTPKLLNVPPENDYLSVDTTVAISPDSQRVVFYGSGSGRPHLYSVPIAGGSAPIPIDGPLPPGGGIEKDYLQFTPDGRYLLYRGEGSIASSGFHYDLFATPTDGSSSARMLNNPALFVAGYPHNFGFDITFRTLSDSRHVIFGASPYQEGERWLYVADLAASGGISIQQLVRGAVPAGSDGFLLAIDGANFVPGTSVEWNSQVRPATFVSDRRINVPIEAADLVAAGPIPVRGLTPGNERSNVVYFFVTPTGQLLANTSVYLPLAQR